MGGERVHVGDESGGGELLFVEGFVEIKDGEGESRPGGMFGGVEGGIVRGGIVRGIVGRGIETGV